MRRFFSAIAAMLALSAMLLPGVSLAIASDKNVGAASASTATTEWTNPFTGIPVAIPADWVPGVPKNSFEPVPFKNAALNELAFYFCFPDGMTSSFDEYGENLDKIGMYDLALPLQPTEHANIRYANGVVGLTTYKMTIFVAQIATKTCHIIYQDQEGDVTGTISHPELSMALFASGDGPVIVAEGTAPQLYPTEPVAWSNPDTGVTISLPPGWIDAANAGRIAFANYEKLEMAFFECLSSDGYSLADYAAALDEDFSGAVDFADPEITAMPERVHALGKIAESGHKARVTATLVGDQLCRMLSMGMTEKDAGLTDHSVLAELIFKSAIAP